MRRTVWALLIGLFVGLGIEVTYIGAQGPLTPAATLRVRTDSNGYLLIAPATYTASDGPLTNFGNIRLRTDSNGYLLVAMGAAGGTLQLADGSAGAPSLAFASQTNLGFLKGPDAFTLDMVGNGAYGIRFVAGGNGQVVVPSTGGFAWSNGAITSAATTIDLQMAHLGDGILQLKNGAGTGFTRLVLGTNDATANGASFVLSAGALIASTGDGSARANLVANAITVGSANGFIASSTGKVTTYSGVATAAWGVPAIVADGRFVAQVAAKATVATYTVGAADGSFDVDANVLVTTATSHSFGVSVVYTDEGSTVRTVFMSFYTAAGFANGATAIINANGAIPYMGVPLRIRAKAATAITIATSGTFTTVTYNVEGGIRQIS